VVLRARNRALRRSTARPLVHFCPVVRQPTVVSRAEARLLVFAVVEEVVGGRLHQQPATAALAASPEAVQEAVALPLQAAQQDQAEQGAVALSS
jgi:hypothetical protein